MRLSKRACGVVCAAGALALFATSCRSGKPRGPVDSALVSCIPSDTVALAGIDIAAVKASPALADWTGSARLLPDSLGAASYALIAYNGKDVLVAMRGNFSQAPAGASLVSGNLVVAGTPEAVRAASTQHATGKTGAGWLLDRAAGVAGNPVWAVAVGGAALPLAGNAANVNRFLQDADYATVAVALIGGIRIELTGEGRDEASSKRMEETLRAFLSLAAVASRQPEIAATLRAVAIQRKGLAVRAELSAGASQGSRLLDSLMH
jgi:hypothetical protein